MKKIFVILLSITFIATLGGFVQNKQEKQNMYVILTGGPGGGKSSVLEVLRNKGYLCVDEVARDLIKEEVAANGDALPWKNTEKFRDNMFREQVKVYESTNHDGIVFFDRGLVDCIAYSRLIGANIPENMDQISREVKFNKLVFVTPPWEDIYQNDEERKQSFQEAIETYDQIVAAYREYGYETVDLPKVSVEDRVDFILVKLGIKDECT
ncbi:AAA family ATPase [Candidatus Peregrinibacteria bacterium]|nr:AAA family ATPase [Candidatus Peregrinibacteria bacterium]